jgi:DNA-binding YbaB/EbfC family protein
MFGDMGKMMQQVKEMKSKMKDVEKELTGIVIEGKSKNQMVTCSVDGKLNLKNLKINPELIAKNDVGAVEKSVKEALENALNQAKATASQKLSSVTGGLNIPGLT